MSFISKVKIQLAEKFPATAQASRFIKAWYAARTPVKISYAQHGEDVIVWNLLNLHFPCEKYNYIDVGAFHPSSLSNTYLFYRKNITGIVVEPNRELINLHKKFRPNDLHAEVACSNENKISPFYFQKTFPALSSLQQAEQQKNDNCKYVPVLTLDTICKSLKIDLVYFLSVDAEGLDFDVLQGAAETLKRTFLICIECNTDAEENAMKLFFENVGFVPECKIACNLIFRNEYFKQA